MEIYPLELHEVSITLWQTSMLAIFWGEKKTTSSSFFFEQNPCLKTRGDKLQKPSQILLPTIISDLQMCGPAESPGTF